MLTTGNKPHYKKIRLSSTGKYTCAHKSAESVANRLYSIPSAWSYKTGKRNNGHPVIKMVQ